MAVNKIKILMVSAEASPLAKVGGMADVVGSLPQALNRLGCDTRIIIPKYRQINDKEWNIKKIYSNILVNFGNKKIKINIYETKKAIKDVIIYLIEDNKYFVEKSVYEENKTEDFLFFSISVLESLKYLKWKPEIIHTHDYHTGFIPAILKTDKFPELKHLKTLYTIHNLAYQGRASQKILKNINLENNSLSSFSNSISAGKINFMVQGIINSDLVNTVSPTYAKEIITHKYAAGLEKVTKKYKNKLSGILNGIDTGSFNPEKDKVLKNKYSLDNPEGKHKTKEYLQDKLGLPKINKPLVGFIGRLTWQKGIELFNDDLIESLDCQFVFLGTGEEKYEKYLKKLAKKYPNKLSANIFFDMSLAREIYAACDIIAMPSRFEPCGLIQMIAMRYGTIPVVRNTGGLSDSVNANVGFKFETFSVKSFRSTLKKAINIYKNNQKKWLKLKENCLKIDFSWDKSAKKYLTLYKKLVKKK